MFINTWFVMYPESGEEQYTFLFTRVSEKSVSDPVIKIQGGVWLLSFDLKTARFDVTIDPSEMTQAELVLNEVTDSADQALFTTDPFQWVALNSGGITIPVPHPPVIQVQRVDNFKCNLLDCNSQRPDCESETYNTRLIALHQGSIYWSDDPTVVNLPDDVGTGPGGSVEYP
jgi:hypothetical protein